MIADLVAWLRAQFDDDERIAMGAWAGDGWRAGEIVRGEPSPEDEVWTGREPPCRVADAWDAATAVHIARYDPTRVLAEVATKRAILAEYDAARINLDRHPDDLAGKGWLLATVRARRLLAAPYADRPGYRQEWRS